MSNKYDGLAALLLLSLSQEERQRENKRMAQDFGAYSPYNIEDWIQCAEYGKDLDVFMRDMARNLYMAQTPINIVNEPPPHQHPRYKKYVRISNRMNDYDVRDKVKELRRAFESLLNTIEANEQTEKIEPKNK